MGSGKGKYTVPAGPIPCIAFAGVGIHQVSKRDKKEAWFEDLTRRLRYVQVVCGDWSRICGGNWQVARGICGVFFDPPYNSDRKPVYVTDSLEVSQAVAQWCLKRGSSPKYRIVLAGFYDEHAETLLNAGWSVKTYKANGGYSNRWKETNPDKKNGYEEALFLSPHTLDIGAES